jgi:putative DNA primase/helicase
MDGDAERVAVIQEIMGYCLLKKVKIHKLFIFLGNGSNGKSLLCNVIGAMLGKQNTSGVLLETIGKDKFAKQNLDGKLANISAEGEGIKFNNVSELKLLTAGDPVEVEKKFKASYTTTITAKFLLCTNTMFTTTDTSDGFYRRLLIVPFNRHYVELKANEQPVEGVSYVDIELEGRLMGELQGIVNWAIEGLQRLHNNGYRMTSSVACEEALARYKKDNNAIESFADDNVTIYGGEDIKIKRSQLYIRFKSYVVENGIPYRKVGNKEFLEKLRVYLQSKGYEWTETKICGDYFVYGISLS